MGISRLLLTLSTRPFSALPPVRPVLVPGQAAISLRDFPAVIQKAWLLVSLPTLPFLVLPYYHRRDTAHRNGYVPSIGFLLRLA
jgi:hypothetical protein